MPVGVFINQVMQGFKILLYGMTRFGQHLETE